MTAVERPATLLVLDFSCVLRSIFFPTHGVPRVAQARSRWGSTQPGCECNCTYAACALSPRVPQRRVRGLSLSCGAETLTESHVGCDCRHRHGVTFQMNYIVRGWMKCAVYVFACSPVQLELVAVVVSVLVVALLVLVAVMVPLLLVWLPV